MSNFCYFVILGINSRITSVHFVRYQSRKQQLLTLPVRRYLVPTPFYEGGGGGGGEVS